MREGHLKFERLSRLPDIGRFYPSRRTMVTILTTPTAENSSGQWLFCGRAVLAAGRNFGPASAAHGPRVSVVCEGLREQA